MDPLNDLSLIDPESLSLRFGLPLHVLYLPRFADNVASFREVVSRCYPPTTVLFAVKSNPCRGAIRAAVRLGLGLDVVSEFELRVGVEEGADLARIVCHGNAKTDEYLNDALDAGVTLSVGSFWELDALESLAARKRRSARVLLRFSGMDTAGFTAPEQSTASSWTKFGFPLAQSRAALSYALKMRHLEVVGIAGHVGTQVCDLEAFRRLLAGLALAAKQASALNLKVDFINLGGGFPVNYLSQPAWEAFQSNLRLRLSGKLPESQAVTWGDHPMGFARGLERWEGKSFWSPYPGATMLEYLLTAEFAGVTGAEILAELGNPRLIIEPGRALIGTAGLTLARVAGVKQVLGNYVTALDLGVVNHGTALISPDIYPVTVFPPRADDQPVQAFLAGRLCFTGDMPGRVKAPLNRLPQRGDILVIHHTGAYCADHFASNSCGFPLPAKVAITGDGNVQIWRRRQTFEDVFPVMEGHEGGGAS